MVPTSFNCPIFRGGGVFFLLFMDGSVVGGLQFHNISMITPPTFTQPKYSSDSRIMRANYTPVPHNLAYREN